MRLATMRQTGAAREAQWTDRPTDPFDGYDVMAALDQLMGCC
jgi:hypothetical protein